MSKRHYLASKLKEVVGDYYDEEDLATNVLSYYDKGQLTAPKIIKYLGDCLVEKAPLDAVMKDLETDGFWKTEPSEDPRYDQLKWRLAEVLGHKYEQTKAQAVLLSKLNDYPPVVTPQAVRSFLSDSVDNNTINRILAELDELKFWAEAPIDPSSYSVEQETLHNYEADYLAFPPTKIHEGKKQSHEPVEKVLLRCLIMAMLLKVDRKYVLPSNKEFQREFSVEDVKKEVLLLKNAINIERSPVAAISKVLEEIASCQPPKDQPSPIIFNYLLGIKEKLVLIDVPDLCRLVDKTKEIGHQIQGKELLVFIGETGSGKTTTIKALLGYKMGMNRFKGMNWLTIVQDVTDPIVKGMASNPECKSVTRYIVAVKPKSEITTRNIYLADTPGWGDTAGTEVQLANLVGVREALRLCKKLLPVIVVSKESWGARGNGIRELGKSVASLFNDFEAIKNSVAIVFNRFTEEEMKEMPSKIQSIIENMTASEEQNENLKSFFNHLNNLAESDRLTTFEPLRDSPKKFMQHLIGMSLLSPKDLFQNSNPATAKIKNFSADTSKRVLYHLKAGNADMVKYFVRNLERLHQAIDDDSILEELKSIKSRIEQVIREDFRRVVDEFSVKIATLSITKKDIQMFSTDVKNLVEGKGYNTIVDNLDLMKEGEEKLHSSMKDLASGFMRERREGEESRNIKALEAIMLIYECKASDTAVVAQIRELRKWVAERIQSSRIFSEMLNKSEYTKAAKLYQETLLFFKYKRILEVELNGSKSTALDNELKQVSEIIPNHTRKLIEEGQNYVKRLDMRQTAAIDKQLNDLISCHSLLDCMEEKDVEYTTKSVRAFLDSLREKLNGLFESIQKILMAARSKAVDKKKVEQLAKAFEELQGYTQIESIKLSAQSYLEQVQSSIELYIDSQRSSLMRAGQTIEKNPQNLSEQIEQIQTALKGLELLTGFVSDKLKDDAIKIRDETLRQLETTLPRIFDSLKEKTSLKYNAPDCNIVFNKMCEAVEMEKVFSKLDMFEDKHRRLIDINAKNKDSLNVALCGAEECIRALKLDEEKTAQKLEEQYTSVAANSIELALKFIELASDASPFLDAKETARNYLTETRLYVRDYRAYCEKTFRMFASHIIKSDADVKELSPQKDQSTIHNQDRYELVGDRCREAWRWARRVYQQVKGIAQKYPTFEKVGGFEVKQMEDDFKREISGIYEDLAGHWSNIKASAKRSAQVNLLIKKCETFKKSDSDIIGSVADDFVSLRQEVRKKLQLNEVKTLGRVEILINNRDFKGLKEYMSKLKGQYSEDHVVFTDAKQKIQDFENKFLKEKGKKLQELKLQKIQPNELPQYADIQEELAHFIDGTDSDRAKQLLKEFKFALQQLKPRITKELDDCIGTNCLREAKELMKQLEVVEKTFPPDKEESDSTYMQYNGRINAQLEKVKVQIQEGNNEEVKMFFKRNLVENGNNIPQILELKGAWENNIANKFGQCLHDLQEAKEEESIKTIKREADRLLAFFPETPREKKLEMFRKEEKSAQDRIQNQLVWLKKKNEELKNYGSLQFGLIEKQLKSLKVKSETDLEEDLNQNIKWAWEKQQQQLSGMPLRDIIGVLVKITTEFLVKARDYQHIIGISCNNVLNSFRSICEKELDKLKQKIGKSLVPNDKITEAQTKQLSSELAAAMEELFQSMKVIGGAKEHSESKNITETLDKYQKQLTALVVSEYQKYEKAIDLKQMFTGKIDLQAFSKLEMIMRLGKTVDYIREHMTNTKASDSEASILSKFKEIAKSEDILAEFDQLMAECEQRVVNFDLTNERFDNTDERELSEAMFQLKRSISNIEGYRKICVHRGLREIDTKSAQHKLKRDVDEMLVVSERMTLKLEIECEDKQLAKLNRITLMLKCYDKIMLEGSKYRNQLQQSISDKISSDESKVEEMLTKTDEELKKSAKVQANLKQHERDEINRLQKELGVRHAENTKRITEDLDNQIEAVKEDASKADPLRQRKQAELNTELTDYNEKKDKISKDLKAQFAMRIKDLQKGLKLGMVRVSKEISRFKQIETNLIIAQEFCKSSLGKFMAKVKSFGTKFVNMLAAALESEGSYGNIVLKEHNEIFGSYNSKKFTAAVANAGYEFVADNIPDLSAEERKQIKSLYKKFKSHLDIFTLDYSKTPTTTFINQLKKTIGMKARQLKRDYESNSSESGWELLAEIFALWTILKAGVTEEGGVEYLYEPHPAQVAAMFLILGVCGNKRHELGNRIAQVLTGEGKSVVLGGLSCFLALVGFDVYCMCYSRLLSRRDYQDFTFMFDALDIKQLVFYGTFGEVTERLFNSKRDLRKDVADILLTDKDCSSDGLINWIKDKISASPRRKTLLVDEVDVFFAKEFFGQSYSPCASIKHECIERLATYVWQNRNDINYEKLVNSQEFAACVRVYPNLKTILEYNAINMVNSVKNYKHDYILHEGKIGYVLQEGISFKASYGWKTVFAYYYQAEQGSIKVRAQDFAEISIICCEMSYAELPRDFDFIMGVTGTLSVLPQCQKRVLEDWYKITNFYYIPSVYGKNNREKFGAFVSKKQKLYEEICKSIKAQLVRGRPVMVFFANIDAVNDFYLSQEFGDLKDNTMTLTERNDKDATKARIIRATRPKNITLLTRAFGRGFDFVVDDESVKKSGGLHVIQAFISQDEAESAQIEGRAARQGCFGSYEIQVDEDELKKLELTIKSLEGKNPKATEDHISKTRNVRFENSYTGQIKDAEKCKESYENTKKTIEWIRSGKNDKVREEINKLNKIEGRWINNGDKPLVKTVIGIDATGSMTHALDQVLKNTRICLERTYQILKDKGVTSGFEIQMAVYRNYNSPSAKAFQCSPFSNNHTDLVNFLKEVSAEGGWGSEAIENLYNHVLNFETDVSQLIVIGDAPCNTAEQTKQKRSSKDESYWKKIPRFAQLLDGAVLVKELAKRKIPVHSFYIGSGPQKYFEEVSKLTDGECSEYKCQETDAAEKLAAFIVQNVLNKIGGKDLVQAYRDVFKIIFKG